MYIVNINLCLLYTFQLPSVSLRVSTKNTQYNQIRIIWKKNSITKFTGPCFTKIWEAGATRNYAVTQSWLSLRWKEEGRERFLETESSEHWLSGTARFKWPQSLLGLVMAEPRETRELPGTTNLVNFWDSQRLWRSTIQPQRWRVD